MSRVPPFPTRRRSPSHSSQTTSAPSTSTRPLQISRPISRPETPNSPSLAGLNHAPPNTAPIGPTRPQRSERRARVTDNGSDRASLDQYRDSVSTTRSDTSAQLRTQQQQATSQSPRPKPHRSPTAGSENGSETTPTSLVSVMSAFHAAGSRRRAMTNGSDDFEYQRQRQEEIEAEKARQQRIQEKALKRKGTARVGDIDGAHHPHLMISSLRCGGLPHDQRFSMRLRTDGNS